jgi:hypothetical protein
MIIRKKPVLIPREYLFFEGNVQPGTAERTVWIVQTVFAQCICLFNNLAGHCPDSARAMYYSLVGYRDLQPKISHKNEGYFC